MGEQVILIEKESLEKRFSALANEILQDIADKLVEADFPIGKKFDFKGETVSQVSKPQFWLEYDDDAGSVRLRSNIVPAKPDRLYIKDKRNINFLVSLSESVNKAYNTWRVYNEVENWIANGKPCKYRYGWGWKGASARPISKDDAKTLLPKYSFGEGFFQLKWAEENGEKYLEFNELSENDMW